MVMLMATTDKDDPKSLEILKSMSDYQEFSVGPQPRLGRPQKKPVPRIVNLPLGESFAKQFQANHPYVICEPEPQRRFATLQAACVSAYLVGRCRVFDERTSRTWHFSEVQQIAVAAIYKMPIVIDEDEGTITTNH